MQFSDRTTGEEGRRQRVSFAFDRAASPAKLDGAAEPRGSLQKRATFFIPGDLASVLQIRYNKIEEIERWRAYEKRVAECGWRD